ncbi:ATP-binding cassette domain-containing protein [Hominifimenecus sp. rT4P-3]|uniref:ATP-binding cassette domain-containing protein n=1 Tax=Hominifimenecus sp. rT4P-3 TaxID=3242979 RepID=UPI003DA452A6
MELEVIQVSQTSCGHHYTFSASFSEGIHLLSGSDTGIKTQFLKILTGTKKPECGNIYFLGYDIFTLGRAYQNHLAYFSRFPLFPGSFSLSHYLIYTGLLQRLEPDQARGKASVLLQTFELSSYADKTLDKLSESVRKRVLLINTLHSEAPILLLDQLFCYMDDSDLPWVLPHLVSLQKKKIILISVEDTQIFDGISHQTYLFENGSVKTLHSPLSP